MVENHQEVFNDFCILQFRSNIKQEEFVILKMIELLEDKNLENFVTVISSVCVGNVGQLACDLLIQSLNLKKLGYVWHPSVLPLAGPNPYGTDNEPGIGCELYISTSLKLIVFIIRSAITKSGVFLDNLVTWLKENKVRQVIVLTGSSAHERRDKQLMNEPLRFVFCPLTNKQEAEEARKRNWIELEQMTGKNALSSTQLTAHIPGAGLTVKLFNKCMKTEIPCSILLCFCSEGDNIPDALKLADYLDEWMNLKGREKVSNWKIPPSWNHMFGFCPPIEIFN